MGLRMLRSDVGILPIEDPDVSSGGIIIPDEAKQRVDNGVVLFKGPDVKDLAIGDHVLFSGYSGDKVSISGENIYYVIPENFVIAVIDPGETPPLFPLQTIRRLVMAILGEFSTEGRLSNAERGQVELFAGSLLSRFEDFAVMEGIEF